MKELFLDTEPRVTLGNLIGQLQQKLNSNDLSVEAILEEGENLILSVAEDPTVQLRPEEVENFINFLFPTLPNKPVIKRQRRRAA